MAEPNPLIPRRRVVQVKVETDKGTAETATMVHLWAIDPSLKKGDTRIERKPANARYGGALASVDGELIGTFTCRTPLQSDGTDALDAGIEAMLQACGTVLATKVNKLTVLPSEQKTVTIELYEDGRRKRLQGCQGNPRLVAENGGIVYVEFDMMGVWMAPDDQAIPSPTKNAAVPIKLKTATLTIDAWEPRVRSIAIDLGAVAVAHEDVAVAAGVAYYDVVDNAPVVELDPLAVKVADFDVYGKAAANTAVAFLLVLADAAVTITIAAAECNIMTPDDGDRDGRLIDPFSLQCLDLDDDNDALTITTAAV